MTKLIGNGRVWMPPVFPAPGGQETGPGPTDRGKLGSKRYIVVDTRGIPLVITVTGANRHDSMAFESTLDAIPAVSALNGQPRKRPGKLHADEGYDFARCRHRWVVERTHIWFAGFGKLRIRFERRLDIHVALPPLLLPLSIHASLTTCVSDSQHVRPSSPTIRSPI